MFLIKYEFTKLINNAKNAIKETLSILLILKNQTLKQFRNLVYGCFENADHHKNSAGSSFGGSVFWKRYSKQS